MLNLMILVTEDDKSGSSHFFLDLANLNTISSYKNINCHILYYSLKNHGNYYFHVSNGKHEMKPLSPLEINPTKYIDMACEFLLNFYDPNATNAFLFSSHCWTFHIRPFRRNISGFPLVTFMEKEKMKFKFILFDCCNTSCVETLYMYRNVTDYLVGCQSAAPSIGFLSRHLPKILSLHGYNKSWPFILKKIANAFLERNNTHDVKRDLYQTDCVVLSTKYASQIPEIFNDVTFYRDHRARTQPTPQERTIFDLVTLLKYQDQMPSSKKSEIWKWVKRTILQYKQSDLMKSQSWAHNLHGLSLILNRTRAVKHF